MFPIPAVTDRALEGLQLPSGTTYLQMKQILPGHSLQLM